MMDALRPILELSIVIPGLILAYIPMKSYLKLPMRRLIAGLIPMLTALIVGGGLICYRLRASTALALPIAALCAAGIYIASLRVSLWKSGSVAVSVCAVYACLNSLTRALDAALAIRFGAPPDELWFCLRAGICENAMGWFTTAIAWYPAAHAVKNMVEDENFAQTWYIFWALPLIFIALNLFMIPQNRETLYTGRVLQGYIIISLSLLIILFWFNVIFLLMANSLNRIAKLRQENHFLSLQRKRYENLKTAIEDARQARHDLRHYLNQLSALADEGDIDKIREYLTRAAGRIPSLDMNFCENRAADSVIGYYCALARRESIPFQTQIDLPEEIPVDEIDVCLVLSNLLENALEASLRTDPARRRISVQAYMHSGRLMLIQVENAFDGEIREKNGALQSSKRKGGGIGVQSVRRIAEKTGGASTFTYQNATFTAKVMLHGGRKGN